MTARQTHRNVLDYSRKRGETMVSEKKKITNKRYDDKTYKRILFKLRIKDDADIIRDIEFAQKDGVALREWLRDLFTRANK